jgi:hypothetical protein
MSAPNTEGKSPLFSGNNILRIIGFIADIATIITILAAIKLPNAGSLFPGLISPWSAIVIWIVAAYTYLCLLHDYLRKTRLQDRWSSSFAGFVSYDLINHFSKPWLLLPLLLLILALSAIIYIGIVYFGRESQFLALMAIFATLFLGAMIAFIMLFDAASSARFERYYIEQEMAQAVIDDMWKAIKPLIRKKLSTAYWLEFHVIENLLIPYRVDRKLVKYVIAKYAAEHPYKAHYGDVYQYTSLEKVEGDLVLSKVLINTEKLDRSRYFYG